MNRTLTWLFTSSSAMKFEQRGEPGQRIRRALQRLLRAPAQLSSINSPTIAQTMSSLLEKY